MSKRRDAGTGQYISEEDAKTLPENTWVLEKDSKKTYQDALRALYDQLLAHAGHAECEDFESVKVEWITKIFKEAGLDDNNS